MDDTDLINTDNHNIKPNESIPLSERECVRKRKAKPEYKKNDMTW